MPLAFGSPSWVAQGYEIESLASSSFIVEYIVGKAGIEAKIN